MDQLYLVELFIEHLTEIAVGIIIHILVSVSFQMAQE